MAETKTSNDRQAVAEVLQQSQKASKKLVLKTDAPHESAQLLTA
jgi:hypothetical protein